MDRRVFDGSTACSLKNELTIESDRFVLPDSDPLVDRVHARDRAA
jgi:hypothetical protein